MKKIFRINAIAAVLVSWTFAFVSCTDLSDLEKRVDSLDSRITALENQISGLNSNIEALAALAGGATINSVTEKDGTYTIVLTNGETITLAQGSDGIGFAPKMSVDKDGYWMVDYSDGKGSVYLTDASGNKIKATGESGSTPVVGVDKDGYWTVDYGNGPQRVKDSNGNDVNALTETESGTSFFNDVTIGDGVMIITMKNGEVLEIPIVPDFLCTILDTFGVQVFECGQTKTYNMSIKGVESTFITAPAGWQASLSESTLTVTAPATLTKAAIADTRTDVSVLAISAKGFAAVSKLQVEAVAGEVEANPQAIVTAGEATVSSVSFNVAVSDVTDWYYLLKKSSEAQPDAAAIKADGMKGSDKIITIDGLSDGTSYTLYVLPVNGDKEGPIASAEAKTVEKVYNTLYEKYEAGADLTIGGKVYNKSVYGEAKLISSEADAEITQTSNAPAVFFVDPSVTAIKKDASVSHIRLVIIGNDPSQRSNFKLTDQIKLNVDSNNRIEEELVFCNINYSSAEYTANYPVVQNANAAYKRVCFDNCRIELNPGKPLSYISPNNRSIENLIIENSEIKVEGTPGNFMFINANTSTATYSNITLRNNILYWDGAMANFKVFNGKSATVSSVVIENNTFINIKTATDFMFHAGTINNTIARNNLVYVDDQANNMGFIRGLNVMPTSGACEHNAYYCENASSTFTWQIFFGGLNKVSGMSPAEEMTRISANPFDGGTYDTAACKFVPNSSYSSYGAQR